jgi:NAD(P)-dependent dehydrogenase (short-subunit alcohol dehydrogenase family)
VIKQVARDSKRLDCLVNNAGQSLGWRSLDAIDLDDVVTLFRVNVVSYIAAAKFALPYLRTTGGSIVNIGSIVSETGSYWSSDYAATKGAIAAFTKALAIDEADNGVRVNAVLPGNVMTQRWRDMIANGQVSADLDNFVEAWSWLGRSCTPNEVGHLVLFLASQFSTYITGATIPISGGAELGFGRKQPFGEILPRVRASAI